MSDEREKVEAARQKVKVFHPDARYTDSGIGTGVIQANDGVIGESMMAPDADGAELAAWLDAASRLPAPSVSQPVDAAQFESGDGLPPLLAEWEDANVQRVYSILNDELEHKSDEEHWEGYCARWIVGELIDPLNAEIQRLKGLLREIEDEAYDRVDIDNEGRPNWAMRVHERIKAAVTGE